MASISSRGEWMRLRPVGLGPGRSGSSKAHSWSDISELYPVLAILHSRMKSTSGKSSTRLHTHFYI